MASTKVYKTGDGREITIEEIAKCYKSFVSSSAPIGGKIRRLGDHAYSFHARFSAIDCDRLENVSTFKIYSLTTRSQDGNETIESVRCISDFHETSELHSVTSNNGRFMARIKVATGDSAQKQYLQIWDRSTLVKTIDISEVESHGPIILDETFSNVTWSTSGNQDKLLYVCHSKQPKSESVFKQIDGQEGSRDPLSWKREFLQKESWGDSLAEIEHTMIAVLDLSNNFKIKTYDVEGYSLACPQWFNEDSKIVSIGYFESTRKLGLIYCNNRPSKIIIHQVDRESNKPSIEIKNDDESYHSPRVNNKGDKFVFLSNRMFGPHAHKPRLNIYDLKTNTSRCLADESVGIFIKEIPQNCFSVNDEHVLLVSSCHLFQYLCVLSIDDGKFTKIKFPTAGVTVADFRHNLILAIGSELNFAPTLFVGMLNASNTDDVVPWHQVEELVRLDGISYDPFEIPTEDKSSFISGLMMKPNLEPLQKIDAQGACPSPSTSDLPTMICIHGGPHSAFNSVYIHELAFFVRLGLNILLVNYRGSTGATEDYIQSLCGRVGELDVSDCMQAIRHFVQNKIINPKKLILYGGSHGGFLVCHLSCQSEFEFTSAIVRNPVIDISTLHATSDIPDWSYSEAFDQKKYDPAWCPSREELVKMFECSPISRISETKTPFLVLLGSQDLRVPMFQGQRWVDILRARGVEVECRVYPDNHALRKPNVRVDQSVNTAIWILDHL